MKEFDDQYRATLARMVTSIAPACIKSWFASIEDERFDKEKFAKTAVDIAEALLAEIVKRTAPNG